MSDQDKQNKSEDDFYKNDAYLNRLQDLTKAINENDSNQINCLIEELTTLRETSLFQDLGKLTREIHESINAFSDDKRIAELAENEIPNATERLNFIVTKTNDAAHKTMTGAENTMEVVNDFSGHAEEIKNRWEQFRNSQLSKQEFVALSEDIDLFMSSIPDQTQKINQHMTNIMLAQDYQDITGQMIKQIITMVTEVEEKLVRLVSISGSNLKKEENLPTDGSKAHGPQLSTASEKDVAHGQDDVDDLLASLGF